MIGGSGNGEAIAANKVPGVRAALAWTTETAQLGRLHNDANVISIGARMVSEDDAVGFVDTFLGTAFSGEPRHQRRIDLLSAYEETGELPPIALDAVQVSGAGHVAGAHGAVRADLGATAADQGGQAVAGCPAAVHGRLADRRRIVLHGLRRAPACPKCLS